MIKPAKDDGQQEMTCQYRPIPAQQPWATLAVSLANDCRQRALRQAMFMDEANPSLLIESDSPPPNDEGDQ